LHCSKEKKSHGSAQIQTDSRSIISQEPIFIDLRRSVSIGGLPFLAGNSANIRFVPLLEIRNLTKVFPLGESIFGRGARGEVLAVDDISLDIDAGETLGLVGESGSGKSTLGRLVLRLIQPTSGSIRFDSRDLLAASHSEMRRLRRDMQIIFQDPFGSLDPRMRVEDVISEPLIIHRESGHRESCGDSQRGAPSPWSHSLRQGGIRARVAELLHAVGLDESALRRFPHEFSGGQRQRIGIARALALRPKFIVADEPVSSLDVSVGAQIVNLLAQLQREFGLTHLFISHSMPVVRYLATRIAVMYRGKIVEVGPTEQITERPAHPYTRSLLEATPEVLA
jgi:ABC-type glutathione transport system ATPase component